jgi:hypothetical protein
MNLFSTFDVFGSFEHVSLSSSVEAIGYIASMACQNVVSHVCEWYHRISHLLARLFLDVITVRISHLELELPTHLKEEKLFKVLGGHFI